MIEFLNFTFQNIWHFLVVFILLFLISNAVATIVANICRTIIVCAIDDKEEE